MGHARVAPGDEEPTAPQTTWEKSPVAEGDGGRASESSLETGPSHLGRERGATVRSVWASGEQKYNDSFFTDVAEHRWFERTTLIIIVANAVWICVDVEWNHKKLASDEGTLPLEPLSIVVENLFCFYFVLEVVIRFFAFKVKQHVVFDAWFVFDATLVAFMVLETWILWLAEVLSDGGGDEAFSNLAAFRLLRLLRLTRMARIMRFVPELMVLVKGMVAAMQSVGFILIFLLIIMYAFGIVFTMELGDPDQVCEKPTDGSDPTAPQMFCTLFSSMMTLFTNGVLGDNLAQTLGAIKDDSLVLMWLFVVFLCISMVTLLNMLIGVLCQVIDSCASEEEANAKAAKLRESLRQAFEAIDTSEDLQISQEEWITIATSPEVRATFAELFPNLEDAQLGQRLAQLQETLFGGEGSKKKAIRFEEFVEKIVTLRWDTPANALDIEMLKAAVQSEDIKLRARLEGVEAVLQRALAQGAGASGAGGGALGAAGHGGPLRPPSEPAPMLPLPAAPGGVSAVDEMPEETQSGRVPPPKWLESVPTELLFQALKSRPPPNLE